MTVVETYRGVVSEGEVLIHIQQCDSTVEGVAVGALHSAFHGIVLGIGRPASFIYHQSTFRDNRFLPEAYVASLEDLYRTNPVKARVFCDGMWGVDTEGLV